jgi:signal peptidase II
MRVVQMTTERPERSTRSHWLPLIVVAGLVVVVDQVAKAAVRASLEYGATERVFGILRLHHTRNDGVLGGHVSGAAIPLGIATVVVVAIGLRYYARRRDLPTSVRIAAGLALGGAIGNMIDRLRLGYVTDFIARGDRNAFNLADLAIYAGLGTLAVLFARSGRRTVERPDQPDGGP